MSESERPSSDNDQDEILKQELEDELKDSSGWYSYLFPRPIRKVLWAAIGANSAWGALILAGRYSLNGQQTELLNVGGNLALTAFCGFLLYFEFQQEALGKEKRKVLRQKQIALGDRQVYAKYDPGSGRVRTFSKLKPVDADWIIRRIDQWGKQETIASGGKPLPTVGPAKGEILEELVRQYQPSLIVDVGTFVGYAAIRMARRQPPGGVTVTMEKDVVSYLTASRFVWQSKLWQQYPWEEEPEQRVVCWLGDALQKLPQVAEEYGPAGLVLIDGRPSEYLAYLEAAERCGVIAPGTVVVADNVGLFAQSPGVREYLERVRAPGGPYQSRTITSTLEYRDDTPDALEVSIYRPDPASQSPGPGPGRAGGLDPPGPPSSLLRGG